MNDFKELMTHFKALSEDEQKDLLFVILDSMDFYEGEWKKAKGSRKDKLWELYTTYEFVSSFLLDDPPGFKELGLSTRRFNLMNAHRARLDYEKEKNKA